MRRWLLLLPLCLTGCVPTTWLPDSSGFIYVKPIKGKNPFDPPSGQLVHFDLQKKTSRIIVEDIGVGTNWPALAPEGKRIAIARFSGDPKQPRTVQIVLFDMAGKELHKTKELSWAPARPNNLGPSAGVLFWSPKDDMVVVSDLSETGIYSVTADTLKVIEKSVPVIHGGSPIRPDGKGFLLLSGEKENQHLAFVDWTGAEQKIDGTPLTKLLPADKSKIEMEAIAATFISSLLLPSWWEDRSAWVGFKRDRITYAIDTVKKTIEVSDGFAAMTKAKKGVGEEEPLRFDFAGDIMVRLSQFSVDDPVKQIKKTYNKVVIVNDKTKKEETLLDKAPAQGVFLPSPDGQYLALCLSGILGDDDAVILVINSKGELTSRINFGQ
jgi:Tol biopolymer transport system component